MMHVKEGELPMVGLHKAVTWYSMTDVLPKMVEKPSVACMV